MKTSAVIPAYNEATTIEAVITAVMPQVDQVIVVDDASTDTTAELAKAAGAVVCRHVQNCGAGAATMTGLALAREQGVDIAILLDADGQHDAADIPVMIKPVLADEADIVFGNRFGRRNRIPLIRRIFNAVGNLITFIATGRWIADSQCGFKVLGPKALREVHLRMSGFEFCTEMVRETVSHRWRVAEVPIKVVYSEYTIAKGQSFANGVKTALKILLRSFLR